MDQCFKQKLIEKYKCILEDPVRNLNEFKIYFINVPENLKLIKANGVINEVLKKLFNADKNSEIVKFLQEYGEIFQPELEKLEKQAQLQQISRQAQRSASADQQNQPKVHIKDNKQLQKTGEQGQVKEIGQMGLFEGLVEMQKLEIQSENYIKDHGIQVWMEKVVKIFRMSGQDRFYDSIGMGAVTKGIHQMEKLIEIIKMQGQGNQMNSSVFGKLVRGVMDRAKANPFEFLGQLGNMVDQFELQMEAIGGNQAKGGNYAKGGIDAAMVKGVVADFGVIGMHNEYYEQINEIDEIEQNNSNFDQIDINQNDIGEISILDWLLQFIKLYQKAENQQQFSQILDRHLQKNFRQLGFIRSIDVYNYIRAQYLNNPPYQERLKLAKVMLHIMQNDQVIQKNQFFTEVLLRDNIQDIKMGKYQLYALMNRERENSSLQNLKLLKQFIDFLQYDVDAMILFLQEAQNIENFKKKRQNVLDFTITYFQKQNKQFSIKQFGKMVLIQDLNYEYSIKFNPQLQKQLFMLVGLSQTNQKEEKLGIIIYLVDNEFIRDNNSLKQLLYPYIQKDQSFLSLFSQLTKIIDARQSNTAKIYTGIQMFQNFFPQQAIKNRVLSAYSWLDSGFFSSQK